MIVYYQTVITPFCCFRVFVPFLGCAIAAFAAAPAVRPRQQLANRSKISGHSQPQPPLLHCAACLSAAPLGLKKLSTESPPAVLLAALVLLPCWLSLGWR
jgi:hypothetical protein